MKGKIAVVGIEDPKFCYRFISNAINSSAIEGWSLVIYDLDKTKLKIIDQLAKKMNAEAGRGLEVEPKKGLREALEGADFVIVDLRIDKYNRWRKDWSIPYSIGIKQVIGENGGPGGLFNTLRIIPPILDLAHTMEEVCPKALMLNFTTPVPRICLAVSSFTDVKVVGVCNEIDYKIRSLAKIMGVPTQILTSTSAGINYFSFFKELKFKDGSNAYPSLEEGLRKAKGFQPLSKAIYKKFGLFPSTSDNYLGEYLAYGWEACLPDQRGIDWINQQEAEEAGEWKQLRSIIQSQGNPEIGQSEEEAAIRIISGIISNSGQIEPQINILNKGQIKSLLLGSIVESPAKINRSGIHPIDIGELPSGISTLCNLQIIIQGLAVQAAIKGDREIARKAMLLDPVIRDNNLGMKAFEALFKVHEDMLPQFKKDKTF